MRKGKFGVSDSLTRTRVLVAGANVSFFGALCPSKSRLIHKHIVKLVVACRLPAFSRARAVLVGVGGKGGDANTIRYDCDKRGQCWCCIYEFLGCLLGACAHSAK